MLITNNVHAVTNMHFLRSPSSHDNTTSVVMRWRRTTLPTSKPSPRLHDLHTQTERRELLHCNWLPPEVTPSGTPTFFFAHSRCRRERSDAVKEPSRAGQCTRADDVSEAAGSEVLPRFSLRIYLNARILSWSKDYFSVITKILFAISARALIYLLDPNCTNYTKLGMGISNAFVMQSAYSPVYI